MNDPGERRDLPRHGGDLDHATARYGMPPGGWLDLSTGINPRAYPAPTVAASDLVRLPGRDALSRLIAAARAAYDVPPGVGIIAVPGSEAAIGALPFVAPPGPVVVVGPTYGSHAAAWRAAGRDVAEVASIDRVDADAAIAVIANPNNPDGRTVTPDRLTELARRLGDRGGLLVVDEAFADLDPGIGLGPVPGGMPAVVLRSFGKFHGLPGLRLGFVAGHRATLDRLAAVFGDWPVSGPALSIGQAALADRGWREATRRRLADDAARLRALLAAAGLTIAGGTDLFVLIADAGAGALHAGLARQGVWTRAFADRPEWLRFGLPADGAGFARLERALVAITPAASAAALAR
jgi:cobalamin biosynthetic protein CobC